MAKRVASIDKKRCVACGVCENTCPLAAVKVHRGCYAVVEEAVCVGCGKCAQYCPAGFRPSDWVSGTCALDIGDSGGSYHGGIHIDATGGVYINGFATYATVYAQISFVAAS